ncbi:DUF2993 domain-containing protein [Nakamurella sp.]|uniref:LmeA family phospholipid-binding protein n=1 Tax=Nakamurella sp. TaxID=1869182 RepID=UPI003B3A70E4
MRKLLITLVVLAVLLVATDFGGRAYAEYRAASAIQTEAGLPQSPDVSIEGFPFLLHAVQGSYPQVVVSAGDVGAAQLPGTQVRLTLTTVTLPLSDALAGDTSRLTAQTTATQVVIPIAALQSALPRQDVTLAAGPNGTLQASATLSVAGVSIPVTGSASLSVADDQLTITVDNLSAAGIDLTRAARDAASALASGLTTTIPLAGLPFTVTSGTVQTSGSDVVITVDTGPVTFQDLRR